MPGMRMPSFPCGELISTGALAKITSLYRVYEVEFLFLKIRMAKLFDGKISKRL
jgi:hypothetical protein